nr:MAG TPA: hypothetical protein [Inoviridae sp.]
MIHCRIALTIKSYREFLAPSPLLRLANLLRSCGYLCVLSDRAL